MLASLIGRIIAALVFFVLLFLGGIVAVVAFDLLWTIGMAAYAAHPIFPVAVGAAGALYGFTRT